MDEREQALQYLEEICDAEHKEIIESKRQHHTDWDNHILTLSTLSLGFVFTFLPISNASWFSVIVAAVLGFVASIVCATINYVCADIGMNRAINDVVKRKSINQQIRFSMIRFNQEIKEAEANDDHAGRQRALDAHMDEMGELKGRSIRDDESQARTKINTWINRLNYAKTYTFVFGIACTVVFALRNIDRLG